MEPVLLLLLHRGASHGYDLVSALEPFGLSDVAPGPVYRMLRQMEESGLVRSEWDTDASGGPARRVYQLTEEGHHHLTQWVEDLRHTDSVLHHFLEAYDRHIEEGSGKYH
jgi:poly-beta-hydroxybutyrate-responsive repressor